MPCANTMLCVSHKVRWMARKLIWVVLCIALFAAYFVIKNNSDLIFTDPSKKYLPPATVHYSDCALNRGACVVTAGDTEIELSFDPADVPPLEPLLLTVQLPDHIGAGDILLWFEGRDMDMGRHFLSATGEVKPVSGDLMMHTFNGMIPVCTVDESMVWAFHVRLTVENQVHEHVFELTSRPHQVSR